MKIYNEIILSWNDKTKQFDTIYEDSFNHTGDVMQLQDYGGGGSGGSGGGGTGGGTGGSGTNTNNNSTQNTDNSYSQLWKNENTQEYKEALSNRISYLILNRFGEIENILGIEGIENIQKTFRDGQLISGRNKSEIMVVYEYDNDANKDDDAVIDSIINWANFLHPSLIDLRITSNSTMGDDGQETGGIILELTAPNDAAPLNINSVVTELDLSSVNLKNNASQFFEIDTVKTNIDRSKLSDFVDTEFSELTPNTFTHLLEKYQQAKNQLPFFSYRTDDFFEEWNTLGQDLPIQYRLKKFFEEFEKIKLDIPDGGFGYNAVTIKSEGTGYYQFEGDFLTSPKVPRKLSIIENDGTEKIIYSSTTGRGHRITIFPQESFVNGKWNGIFKYDRVYDTYAGTSLEDYSVGYGSPTGGLEEADNLANHILDGFPDGTNILETDLVVLTSFDAVRYSPALTNALKSIGAREPRVVQDQNLEDLESSTVNVLAEYDFNVPSHTQVQQSIYSSAASVTKFKHVILPNNGVIDFDLQIHPGFEDGATSGGGASNALNQIVDTLNPGRFTKSAIRQTRLDSNTEYQIRTYGLKPDTEYVLDLWLGVAGRTNGTLLTSNGLSRECEYHQQQGDGDGWCNYDYLGSPEQDWIFHQLGGYERPAGQYVFEHPSSDIITTDWWDTNHPTAAQILRDDGRDNIGTIAMGNVFYGETNYGNAHSPATTTLTSDMHQVGNSFEFYTLHKNQDDSAHFIAEVIFTGNPFNLDDSGIYKIMYCYELPNGQSGCPDTDFGISHNYMLHVKFVGNTDETVSYPDLSTFKPFHARAYSSGISNNGAGTPTTVLAGDESIGEIIDTAVLTDYDIFGGGYANVKNKWEKRRAVIKTPTEASYVSTGGGEGILDWYVGYGNGTGCTRMEMSQTYPNQDNYTPLAADSNTVTCDFVWGSESIPQANNYRVLCDNGSIHMLHWGAVVRGDRLITTTENSSGNDPDLIFQNSYGYTNGLDVDTYFINHNGSFGCNACTEGVDETTIPTWWDNLPEVRDILLSGPYGDQNYGQIAFNNLLMFETNAGNDYSQGIPNYPDVVWNDVGSKLEMFNSSGEIHFIMEKIYDGFPFGKDDNGIWKIMYCYENGCPGMTTSLSSNFLKAKVVSPSDGVPDEYPMGTGITANEVCQNSTLTNNQVFYTDFKIYENNIEEIYDGYYFNADSVIGEGAGEYQATEFIDVSGNLNNLRLISNNVKWMFTSEKGWTLFFPGSGNERLQNQTSLDSYSNTFVSNTGGGTDYVTNYDVLDATKNIDSPGNELTIMFNVYVTEYANNKAGTQIIVNKENQYEIAMCNGVDTAGHEPCEAGEIVWAIKLEGASWYWTGTNYVVPLNSWTHITLTYDGVTGVKIYANGDLVSNATHCVDGTLGLHYASPADEAYKTGPCNYTINQNIASYGTPFSIGARSGNDAGKTFTSQLQNTSIHKVSVSNKALTREQIRLISGELISSIGLAKQRTPYTLIGSPQFNEGEGTEIVTEASKEADSAIAYKYWPPNADYNYWDNNSAAYMISELQRFSNDNIPIYTSEQVRLMKNEIDTLNDKFTNQGLLIDNKNLQIQTLESQLKEGETQLDYHGDCLSVTGGFTCDDNITNYGGNLVYATCSDDEKIVLYCNPEHNHAWCVGKAEYPFGGPINGSEACAGS